MLLELYAETYRGKEQEHDDGCYDGQTRPGQAALSQVPDTSPSRVSQRDTVQTAGDVCDRSYVGIFRKKSTPLSLPMPLPMLLLAL